MKTLIVCLLLVGVAGCASEPAQETSSNEAVGENQQVSPGKSGSQGGPTQQTPQAQQSGQESLKPASPDVDIFKAASDGNLKALKQHIAAGTDLDQRSIPQDQSTPLMLAAVFGQAEAAKALMEAGAKLDLKNKDGSSALMTAAFLCHPEIVQALLDKGADKNITNNTGSTALQSVEGPFGNVQFVYDIINGLVFQPAGLPLDYQRIKATRPRIAELLRQSGGKAAGPAGAGAGNLQVDIFKAAADGNLEALKQHLAAGTDLDQRSPQDQSTPLMLAALFGQAEAAKALMEAGAKVDLKNNDGNTALNMAAFLCRTETVQALLDKGADRNIRNNDGGTALDGVQVPWNNIKTVYELLNGILFQPAGMPLDYERIEAMRPGIAKMLRG